MAAEQKIIQDLDKAFAGLTVTLETLQKVLAQNKAAQQEQIQYIESLKKAIGDSKEWRAFADATAKVTDAQKALTQQQKDALDIAKKEEQLKQQQIRTSEAARKAQEAQTRATEKTKKQSQEAVSLYKQQTDRLRELTRQAKEAAIAYGINSKEAKSLAREQQQLDKQIKAVDASLGINNRNVGNYTKSMLTATMSAVGFTAGVAGMINGFKQIIQLSRDYEKKNAELAAVLGKTVKETQLLQSESRRLGASTAFSATEVVELQTELARLGKTEGEIVAMTKGIIDATLAMGGSTADTAALVGATLNAFQLEAAESARIADVMTLATNKSALSFAYLNTALPTVSGAAKAAGFSFEETVAMLGKLADRGIEASTAATSMRSIFLSLAGSGMTLDESLNMINGSTNKLNTSYELFGERAAVAGLALAENIDASKELAIELENAGGTADRVANEQLDTLDGQLRLLSSAWEELALSAANSESIIGKVSKGIVKSITSIIEQFTIMTGEIKGDELNGWEKFTLRLASWLPGLEGMSARMAILTNNAIANNKLLQDKQTESQDKQTESTEQNIESLGEQIKLSNDLIEIQERLLKLARAMPGTTEEEIAARNKKIQVIEAEIKRLKDLGKIQVPEQLTAISEDDILSDAEKARQELDKINDQEIADWLDKEKQKTDITKQYAQEREELQKEVNEKLGELFSEIGNTFFEVENEKYEKAIEANTAYYDGLLANEKLDEEQRSLIEAQKEQRENELRAKQRENEKKQFLFNQAFKVGEILMDTAVKIAAIKATAAVLAANPLTAAAAPFALAQIPLVKLSSALSLGTLLAQSVPQFDKGTESTPDKFIAGEKRPEIMIDKQGNATMVERPTLFVGKQFEGNQIISGADTAKMLANAGNITNAMLLKAGASEQQRDNDIQLLIDRMIAADKSGTNRIVSAINGTKQKDNTLDQLRRENLKKRLKS